MEVKETLDKNFTQDKNNRSTVGLAFQLFLLIVLVLFGLVGVFQVKGVKTTIDQKVAEAKEAGRPADLSITIISDKTCLECSSLVSYVNFIKSKNAQVNQEVNLDKAENQAQQLIQQYQIKKLPAMIITGELAKDAELAKAWPLWGTTQDETFVLTNTPAPYLVLASNKVAGLAVITYLTDKNCAECYDVSLHKNILVKSYGVKLVEERTTDIADQEGRDLIKQYNITKVPTFLTNNELSAYQSLLAVWNTVGSIEADGNYVFRAVEQMGNYYDLTKEESVKAGTQTNTNQGGQ